MRRVALTNSARLMQGASNDWVRPQPIRYESNVGRWRLHARARLRLALVGPRVNASSNHTGRHRVSKLLVLPHQITYNELITY